MNHRSAAWGGAGGDGSTVVLGIGEDVLHVAGFGVTDPTGTIDMTDELQAALAGSAGRKLVGEPGATYLISSQLTIAAEMELDLGATLKKAATFSGAGNAALAVTAADVKVRNTDIDGNRTGGADGHGIKWTGSGGELADSKILNCKRVGVLVSTGGVLDCHRVTSSNHVAVGASDGFQAELGSVLRTYACVADSNDRAGFFFFSAGDGCHLDGRARRNLIAGAWVYRTNKGTCGTFIGDDNKFYNLLFSPESTTVTSDDWELGTVIAKNQGLTDANLDGANVALFGAKRCKFGTIISKGGGGWAVVLSQSAASGVPSELNEFGVVLADNTSGVDTDPAVSLQHGSRYNHFGTIIARGHSWALAISEEYEPTTNDYNTFGRVVAIECPWGAALFLGGSYNEIDKLVARNCQNTDHTLAKGVVAFMPHAAGAGKTKGNRIRELDVDSTWTNTTVPPLAAVHSAVGEAGNIVEKIRWRGCLTDVVDLNGGNHFGLPLQPRSITVLDAFDAGWTGGVDNATAGQFVEGVRGRKLVSNTTATVSISKTITSRDLSAMTGDEEFRMFLYIENVSDKHAANPLVVRIGNDAANYFQYAPSPDLILKNGLMELRLPKRLFTAGAGSVSWAAIDYVELFAVSAAANTFAITFDILERVSPTLHEPHVLTRTPVGGAYGDVVLGTSKLWTNDAGTWKGVAVA